MAGVSHAGHGSGLERGAVHDGRVELDFPVRGENSPAARIE